MQVALIELTAKMTSLLQAKGCSDVDIPFVIEMYLGGELQGRKGHGLIAFPGFVKQDASNLDAPEVLKETPAFFMLDAKSNSGNILGRRLADEAMARAKQNVVGMSFVKNMDSWLRPGAVAQYIADKGFVAVVFHQGGAAFIAPPGGFDPITGTNPIAYGIPLEEGSLVVDMATAKRARSEVRMANKYGTKLPADTFYDSEGKVTLDPQDVLSVMPFGDYKGFSLALLIEVLCGSLAGMPMMIAGGAGKSFGEKTPERAALILVIDPGQTTDPVAFKQANAELIQKIRATRPLPGQTVRIPGDQSRGARDASVKDGFLEIPDELWTEISNLQKETDNEAAS